MRQALIVKNPKWERFTAVSDEFKALSGDAVLVVRGRNKEKSGKANQSKVFKKSAESLAKEIADAAKKDSKK
jgi:ribosomal protein S4E